MKELGFLYNSPPICKVRQSLELGRVVGGKEGDNLVNCTSSQNCTQSSSLERISPSESSSSGGRGLGILGLGGATSCLADSGLGDCARFATG